MRLFLLPSLSGSCWNAGRNWAQINSQLCLRWLIKCKKSASTSTERCQHWRFAVSPAAYTLWLISDKSPGRHSRSDLRMRLGHCRSASPVQNADKYVKTMQKEFGCIPRITTFQRLAILYEKAGQYKEAIEICNLAIKYGLSDSAKGGYPARLQKLEKKLNG